MVGVSALPVVISGSSLFASGPALRIYWLHIAAALGAAAILLAIPCTAFTLIVAARQAWAGGRLRSHRS